MSLKKYNPLRHHFCERDEGWMEYDLHGHPIEFVCEICRDAKIEDYLAFLLGESKKEDTKSDGN